MEYAEKGDLYKNIHNKPAIEDLAYYIFNEIYDGLCHLHSRNIQHRDLKLENILLTNKNEIKICDFGLARSFEKMQEGLVKTEPVGSLYCAAPEAVLSLDSPFDSVDVYSLGCVLFCLISGYYPFEYYKSHSVEDLKGLIIDQKEISIQNIIKNKHISKSLEQFLEKLLRKNRLQRIRLEEIKNEKWMVENEK